MTRIAGALTFAFITLGLLTSGNAPQDTAGTEELVIVAGD